jgi:hypothetical protein
MSSKSLGSEVWTLLFLGIRFILDVPWKEKWNPHSIDILVKIKPFNSYVICDVTLSVYPHRASLKNMPSHGGNRTYDLWNISPILWNTSPMLCGYTLRVTSQISYSPEYITPTQKKFLCVAQKMIQLQSITIRNAHADSTMIYSPCFTTWCILKTMWDV